MGPISLCSRAVNEAAGSPKAVPIKYKLRREPRPRCLRRSASAAGILCRRGFGEGRSLAGFAGARVGCTTAGRSACTAPPRPAVPARARRAAAGAWPTLPCPAPPAPAVPGRSSGAARAGRSAGARSAAYAAVRSNANGTQAPRCRTPRPVRNLQRPSRTSCSPRHTWTRRSFSGSSACRHRRRCRRSQSSPCRWCTSPGVHVTVAPEYVQMAALTPSQVPAQGLTPEQPGSARGDCRSPPCTSRGFPSRSTPRIVRCTPCRSRRCRRKSRDLHSFGITAVLRRVLLEGAGVRAVAVGVRECIRRPRHSRVRICRPGSCRGRTESRCLRLATRRGAVAEGAR